LDVIYIHYKLFWWGFERCGDVEEELMDGVGRENTDILVVEKE